MPPECLEDADNGSPNDEDEGLKDPAANVTENAFVSYSGVFALPVADPLPKVKNAASVLNRSQRGVSYTNADGQGQTLFGDGLLDAALATGSAGCDTLVRFDGVELDIDAGPNACADAQVSFHMP